MSKIVKNSHSVSRRGVDSFALYCSSHMPQILWREESINDFGVDGEIELTAMNSERKIEATGEILKVQIKATSSYNSYMKNETDSTFDFYARKDDLEYWEKHNLDLVLIVFDDKTETLYAQRINVNQYRLQSNKRKVYPITFDKTKNQIIKGDSDFLTKFVLHPKQRLSFDITESLSSNIFKVKDIPKELFVYPAKCKETSHIYDKLENGEYPNFVLYSKNIFTFCDVERFPKFKEFIDPTQNKHTLQYQHIGTDIEIRNHFVELLKKYIKEYLYTKRIYLNKDYSRFYFGKPKDQDFRKEQHITRKREQEGERTVVSRHTYGKDTFYKHWAFEIDFFFKAGLFLIINPKYLFTTDGRQTLEPKKITRYTNALTKREFNGHVLDFVHFYFNLFSGGKSHIEITNRDGVSFILTKYIQLPANFSIPTDSKQMKKKVNGKNEIDTQTSLSI
jgi:hypothetical protein